MKANYLEFNPKEIYPTLNFSAVKPHLQTLTEDFKDYGSIILFKYKGLNFSVNNIGKVILLDNTYETNLIINILTIIEKAFQKEIKEFEITH